MAKYEDILEEIRKRTQLANTELNNVQDAINYGQSNGRSYESLDTQLKNSRAITRDYAANLKRIADRNNIAYSNTEELTPTLSSLASKNINKKAWEQDSKLPTNIVDIAKRNEQELQNEKKRFNETIGNTQEYKDYQYRINKLNPTLRYAKDVAELNEKGVSGLDKVLSPLISGLDNIKTSGTFKQDNNSRVMLPTLNDLKTQKATENANWLYKGYADISQSVGNMLPGIAASAINPALGSTLFFGNTYQNARNQALLEGYDESSASNYGVINATLELGVGKVLGGTTALLGKSPVSKLIGDKITSKLIVNPAINSAISDMISEFGEEYIQEWLDPKVKAYILDKKDLAEAWESSKFFDKQNFYAGLLGALSAGITNTPGTIRQNSALNSEFEKIVDTLQKDGNEKLTNEQLKQLKKTYYKEYNKALKNDTEIDYENISDKLSKEIRTEQSLTNNIEELKEQQKQTTDNKLKQELATKISGLEQELNQFKLPMASTEGMTLQESASKYNIKPETQSAVQNLMENRGIESRWDATKFSDNSVNALWTKDANGNRSVIFNPNASLDTIVEEVALHELTHDILSSENTTLNAQEVLDYVSQLDGYNEARQSLENTYSTMYDPNSAEFNLLIDEEVVADVLGRKLGNQEFINQLVNSKPSIAKSIYNWVISKLNSIVNKGKIKSEKLYWQNIKNNFEKAYKQEYQNTKQASVKYKVSTNTDSQGKELSKQQQEYFKNSKVRDENGNLEVVYHGSQKAGFTKFNKVYNYYTNNENVAQTYSGSQEKVDTRKLESIFDAKSWLKGITDELYIENNSVYDYDGEEILNYQTAEDLLKNLKRDIQIEIGNTEAGGNYEGYVNITNPLIVNVNGGKWSAIDINGIELNNPKEFLEKYGSSTFRENGAIRTSTNDIVAAVSDAIDEGELNFDGIIFKNIRDEGGFSNNQKNSITANDYVTFNSNQFKALDNINPTTNEDIRYSKENTEWNEFLDKNLKDTGTSGTLMALHNIGESKFADVLDLNGIPVGSLAITNPNIVDFKQYGDGTLIFNKSTIDPAIKENEVYDRDVWSPTFPTVEYEISEKGLNKIRNVLKKDDSFSREAYTKYVGNLEDNINRMGLEQVKDNMLNDINMKEVYLNQNNNFKPVMKKEEIVYSNDYGNEFIKQFIDNYDKIPNWYDISNEERDKLIEAFKEKAKPYLEKNKQAALERANEKYDNNPPAYIINIINSNVDSTLNRLDALGYQDKLIEGLYKAQNNETSKTIIDKEATANKINNEIDESEYKKWVDNLLDGIIANKGIRNDKEMFTSSGNRRSWKALHEDYTLSNIVKYLTSKATVGGEEGFGAGQNFGTLQAKMAQKFNSIEDIKKAESRLVANDHDITEELSNVIYDDMNQLRLYNINRNNDYYYGDNVGYALNDFADYKNKNISNLRLALARNGVNANQVPTDLLKKVVSDINSLKDISTDYFEAKPQRAIGLDEIQVAVIPNTWSENIRKKLQEKGIDFVEYDPSIEGDRQRVINKYDNLKFSKNSPEWDNFVNKHIAPEGTKTKLKDIKLPKKEVNLPKSTQVKQETRQEVKLPTRETITKEELEELDSLKALNEITDLSREEQNRLDYLEKKQQGYTERYPGLKKVSDFKEISREYGKYRDLDNFDRTLLRDAESMIKGYRNTERRTKDEWLSIARYIGSNFKGNSEELQKYAIQSWFAAAPNQKGSLNRQGKGFVDFKIQEWINSMYDGARVGELDKPSTPKKQTILPMAREDNVLKVNANEIADFMNGINGNQRKWIGTSTESDVLKDKVLIKDLDASKLNYVVESNQKSVDTANNHLNTYGYEKSLEDVKSLLRSDKLPKASDVALAERVLQEAVKNGDTKTAQDLIMDIAILGTDLGQATQALSIIKRLTPEGQLSMYTKMIQRAKSRGEKSFENVEITPEMVEMVLNAYKSDGTYDQEDLNNRVENFKQEIANQMKTTTGEKINAWRYLAMLGNPKTHIRNIVSNVAMNGTIKVKNAMARTLESVLPIKNRTKTWKKASNFIKNYAETTANEMKGIITGENKYNEKSSLESKKRTFKSDTLEKISNFNSNALEAEDWFFSKRAFISNLEEYLTANGINTQEDIESRPEVVEKAKNYAKEQAEIATFRQYSKLAAQINKLEKNNKLARLFIEATVPFKKTPINVAKAGVKYSPLGLIKSLSYDVYQVKQGNMEASQFIDNLSQGLTGTSLAILGYALAKNGILNGGGDDDKEGKYDTQLGDNQYSLKIGDKSYSISWLSPVAMPLLVGANAFEQLEEKEEWDMNVVSETLAKTLDPLNEMSFMQGLTNALSSYNSGVEKLAGIGESVAQNYVGQFFPTLFSQFASTIDDKKRSTKASANSTYKFGEQTLRSVMYKLPGLRQQLEVATDVWGNEKEQADNIIQRAYESFLAPYSTTKNITSDLDKEIKRVYGETGETKVIPGIPYSYVKYGDETYRMSAKEYTKYKKTYGTTASSTLSSLIKSDSYKNASDEDKSKMIDNAYDYARAKANEEYFSNIPDVNYENKTLDKLNALKSEFGINASTYYANKNEYDYAYKSPEKYKTIKQITTYDKYNEYKDKITSIKENTKNDKEEVIRYINSLNLSIPQKAMFIKQYYKSFNNYDSEIINYVNSQKLNSKDKKIILEQLGFTIKDGRVYSK